MSAGSGVCWRCGKVVRLRRDGMLTAHRTRRGRDANGRTLHSALDGPPPKCPGSGHAPFGVTP